MEQSDYYALLGVDQRSSPEEISQAFRRLALQYHPDANPGNHEAGERFKAIAEAYSVLSNPEKRQDYDRQIADWHVSSQHMNPTPTVPVPPQSGSRVVFDDALASALAEVAGAVADEVREALRDFGAELDDFAQSLRGPAEERRNVHRKPPPPPPPPPSPPPPSSRRGR